MADPSTVREVRDIVDIEGLRGATAAEAGRTPNPWLAVTWRCCGAYSRIYRNRAGSAYEGRCPKCGRQVRATIGPGGTDARFFVAE